MKPLELPMSDATI